MEYLTGPAPAENDQPLQHDDRPTEPMPGRRIGAWPFVILVPFLVGVGLVGAAESGDSGPAAESTCAAAWSRAADISPYQDSPSDYIPTFKACLDYPEWQAETIAHGERIPATRQAAANWCDNHSISSTLCSSLDGESIDDQIAHWQEQPASVRSADCRAKIAEAGKSKDENVISLLCDQSLTTTTTTIRRPSTTTTTATLLQHCWLRAYPGNESWWPRRDWAEIAGPVTAAECREQQRENDEAIGEMQQADAEYEQLKR